MKSKTIFGMQSPAKESCTDRKCPFHGALGVKRRVFVGTVIASKAQKTATVGWNRRYFIPKYERYEMRRTKLHAHLPACIPARDGDQVRIIETKPISKTKNFVVIQNLGRENKIIGEDVTAASRGNETREESLKKTAKETSKEAAKETARTSRDGGKNEEKKKKQTE